MRRKLMWLNLYSWETDWHKLKNRQKNISDAGRWKTMRVPIVIGGDNLPSPVRIGLTDLPNIGAPGGVPASLHMSCAVSFWVSMSCHRSWCYWPRLYDKIMNFYVNSLSLIMIKRKYNESNFLLIHMYFSSNQKEMHFVSPQFHKFNRGHFDL